LISVDGNEAEGEIYALACHVLPDEEGGWYEDFLLVRYIDRYRKGIDGRWRFSKRVVSYDYHGKRPLTFPIPGEVGPGEDVSYAALSSRLFAPGTRA
jgi:hypothetical protein